MLARLANIFRVADLRNKVLFTVSIICLYQLGANLPIPGVSWAQVQLLQSKASASGVLGFLNLFSGGALTRLAVFGLGVVAQQRKDGAALLADPARTEPLDDE